MNIRWMDRPPEDHDLPAMDLLRTPTSGTMSGVITCDKPICVPTHWFGGQTLPCVYDECPACIEQRARVYHVYTSLFNPNLTKHWIFECTAEASRIIYQLAEQTSNLRGVMLSAARRGKRANGKVEILLKQSPIDKFKLPDPPDLKAHLSRIWRVAQTKVAEDHPGYEQKVLQQYTHRTPGTYEPNGRKKKRGESFPPTEPKKQSPEGGC
jgi:hypothetical protein